jgi:hypothetical protein
MKQGDRIILRVPNEPDAFRRLVAVRDDLVTLCSEDEYLLSLVQGREPLGHVFPIEAVIDPFDMSSKTATRQENRLTHFRTPPFASMGT